MSFDPAMLEALSRAGVVAILLLVIYGLIKGLLFTKAALDRLVALYEARIAEKDKEIQDWKTLALQGTHIADKAVDLAERRRMRRPLEEAGGNGA